MRLRELIEDFFWEEKSVAFYADKLHISIGHLNKLCRKNLQLSPGQLIQQRTLLEAKRLLKSTDLSIKEIAFKLGFIDSSYFTNFFKQHTQLNPKQFRANS